MEISRDVIVLALPTPIEKKWDFKQAMVRHIFVEIRRGRGWMGEAPISYKIGPKLGFYPEACSVAELVMAFGDEQKLMAAIADACQRSDSLDERIATTMKK